MTIDIEEFRHLLDDLAQPGADEVCVRLPELCPALFVPGSDIQAVRLKRRVIRVRSTLDGKVSSVVLKCLTPSLAERNERMIRRWLPGLGLAGVAPELVGTIGDRRGTYVWHAYEDLGDTALAQHLSRDAVAATVELVAKLHTRAAGASLLTDCHHHLDDLGMQYFVSNVRDAVARLESPRPLQETGTGTLSSVRDRLLERLHMLLESIPPRAQLMRELGGPPTLLHGDLWTINALVIPRSEGIQARLIDWDRAGIGPVAYDLSTFLYRFPPGERPWILKHYRDEVSLAGWRLPEDPDLNVLCETAECARYANRIVWPAMAPRHESAESEHDELAQVLGWFEALEPLLPLAETGA